MKTLSMMLLSCMISIAVISQTKSTVTIMVKGTANRQLLIDGQNYTPSGTLNNATVTIDNLTPGRHELRLTRWGNTSRSVSTSFTVRPDYDKTIVIDAYGSMQQSETRRVYGAGTKTPMSGYAFNAFMLQVQNARGYEKRRLLTDAFENSNNYFTTAQVRQLLLQVNSQTYRLDLAKASYRSVTDQWNFNQVYNLFNTQSSRQELQAYVNSYVDNTGNTGDVYYPPMASYTYNSLYTSVQNKFGLGAKMSALEDIFANQSYYFTTDQAERLIRLVSAESNRLQLAKLAYSHITDPRNFSQLYDMFSYQSSRTELEAYVRDNDRDYNPGGGRFPGGNRYRVPMSDVDYDYTYSRISNSFGIGVKYQALVDLFARTDNYFTVMQTEKLIRLVSDESNRLYLGKQSYSHLTDPVNVAEMYDMFSSQSSRTEFEAYVRNYGYIR